MHSVAAARVFYGDCRWCVGSGVGCYSEILCDEIVMRTNSEIRKDVQTLMQGNWSNLALISLVFCVIAFFTANSFPLALFVYCPLALGLVITMMHFVRRTKRVAVEDLFSAFNAKFYWKSMGLGILVWIYTFLWSLLFLVPGVIKGCSYFLAPYILVDNQRLQPRRLSAAVCDLWRVTRCSCSLCR